MNRVLLIINTIVLVILLAVGLPLAFEVLSLRGQVTTLEENHGDLVGRVAGANEKTQGRLNTIDQTVQKLDKRLADKPEPKEIKRWLAEQRKAIGESIQQMRKRIERAKEVEQQMETRLTDLTEQQAAAAKARDETSGQLASLRRQVTGEAIDPTGAWTLHNEPTPNQINVQVSHIEDNRYRFATSATAGGVYELKSNGQIEMVKPGSKEYTGFVWKVVNPNKLKLLTTQYAGSTMVRKQSAGNG